MMINANTQEMNTKTKFFNDLSNRIRIINAHHSCLYCMKMEQTKEDPQAQNA